MVEYTLWHRVISKKNSRQIFTQGRRPYSIPSKAYKQFQEDALIDLIRQNAKPQTKPYSIEYSFWMKGKIDQDLDNAICSVNDVLMEANIIGDDKDIVFMRASKEGGHPSFYTKIRFMP